MSQCYSLCVRVAEPGWKWRLHLASFCDSFWQASGINNQGVTHTFMKGQCALVCANQFYHTSGPPLANMCGTGVCDFGWRSWAWSSYMSGRDGLAHSCLRQSTRPSRKDREKRPVWKLTFSLLIKLSPGLGAFRGFGLSHPGLMVWSRVRVMTIQACLGLFAFVKSCYETILSFSCSTSCVCQGKLMTHQSPSEGEVWVLKLQKGWRDRIEFGSQFEVCMALSLETKKKNPSFA